MNWQFKKKIKKNNMQEQKAAVKLQQELLNMDFKFIVFCDFEDQGPVEIRHYSLSKNDEIAKPDSCLFYEAIDLKSERALEVLQSWMIQIKIHPDPRTIKPEPAPLFPDLFNKLKNK